MLQRYSFFGLTLEMLLVFGGFALALVMIVGYAYFEHRRQRKPGRTSSREGRDPA